MNATTAAKADSSGLSVLTRRELEILALVAEGKSNSTIARELWVTEQTVKFHLSNIYRKLDVANRTEPLGTRTRPREGSARRAGDPTPASLSSAADRGELAGASTRRPAG